jgi:NitT/TauT family transport system ATP-binding protein
MQLRRMAGEYAHNSAMTLSPRLAFANVEHRYPDGLHAIAQLSMQVKPGEFVCLVGPSGCGKSTVLRLAAGLATPSAGSVDSPAKRSPDDAHTAFVFQDPTLLPWASASENVYLPLQLAGVARRDCRQQVENTLRSVGLQDFLNAYPSQLSGGMRMRVSIARALVTSPQLLLMDEPFAAVDEITRARLCDDLLAWWSARGLSVLFVTHSVFEAVYLSQRVLVMGGRPGRIVEEVQVDEPYPRHSSFRFSERFAAAVERVSGAFMAAQEDAL